MINWNQVYKLSESEFPSKVETDHTNSAFMYTLSDFRRYSKTPINPSPVEGALARFDFESSTSKHYANKNMDLRKSNACDIFVQDSAIIVFHKLILNISLI